MNKSRTTFANHALQRTAPGITAHAASAFPLVLQRSAIAGLGFVRLI